MMSIKTTGHIVDESHYKMSKRYPDEIVHPEDLLHGTEKMDG